MSKLAIVIPAYKGEYFERAIQSIANQTCKDFSLYIGIDASPYDFEAVVRKYQSLINLQVTRFYDNLGGKDLVSQWERCIDLVNDEEWIWLFSDDDEMEETCVQCFYNSLCSDKSCDLYHFNVDIINNKNDVIKDKKICKEMFPLHLSSLDFAKKRLTYKINSFVVEYIFKTKVFYEKNRFQNFDMAWGADDATWIKLSVDCGIRTIEGSKVRWRTSGVNITSINDGKVSLRKLAAVVELLKFEDSLFKDPGLHILYFWYFLHALFNAMKVNSWTKVKIYITNYRENFILLIPTSILKLINKLLYYE